MLENRWISDVIQDIIEFASANSMPNTAQQLSIILPQVETEAAAVHSKSAAATDEKITKLRK